MRIEIPIPLPTNNLITRVWHWRTRYKADSIIKKYVYIAIQYESGLLTPTQYQSKLLLMESSRQAYLKMIRPKKSKARRLVKSKAAKK